MPKKQSGPVAVVIVTYNSADVLPGLLNSLESGLEGIDEFEVVVVDNDSRDGSADIAMLHPIHPHVIKTGRNGGYAAGINEASRIIDPSAHLLILNPDVRLLRKSVLPLLERLDDPMVGIAVPRNLMPDGATDRTLRREPSVVTSWSEAILGGRLSAWLELGEMVDNAGVYDKDQLVDWASGCALLISARARHLAPQWDETFFLYSEETEYQRRVRNFGLSIAYVPQSSVLHIGGDYQVQTKLTALLTSNKIRYFQKYHGAIATTLFRLGIVIGAFLRFAKGKTQRTALLIAISPLRPPLTYRSSSPVEGSQTG